MRAASATGVLCSHYCWCYQSCAVSAAAAAGDALRGVDWGRAGEYYRHQIRELVWDRAALYVFSFSKLAKQSGCTRHKCDPQSALLALSMQACVCYVCHCSTSTDQSVCVYACAVAVLHTMAADVQTASCNSISMVVYTQDRHM